ncbi:MAG: hypothetical protein EZS28_009571 [Streblomastix strix]|uniref:Uncharacterized protein n=1 Tax=Streblomastix strix TaxID=222440 RepID=A0A5J4WK49_9EUKA|nr:MAG: hypothetical protein EZS28_009571 [Streblomastix strix]
MLKASENNDEAKMAEYIQISNPYFLLLVFTCDFTYPMLHEERLRLNIRYVNQSAELVEYMQQLRGKHQQQQNQNLDQIVVTSPYSSRITAAFCNKKTPKQVSFKDALGSLFEPGRQICSSSDDPSYQQCIDAKNICMMLQSQASKLRQLEKEKNRQPYDDNGNEIDMDVQDRIQLGQLQLRQEGSLLIQRADELLQFYLEPGEEDFLRQIISMVPPYSTA